MTPELAEICGIHAGDGYMRLRARNRGEVTASGHIEEKDYYDNNVIFLINKVFNLELKGRTFHKGNYGFVCYEGCVRDILIELGFPTKKKSKIVRVPETILNSRDLKLYGTFLRGLFDTDGNLFFRKSYAGVNKFKMKYNHYPTITLSTISKGLAEDVLRMLHEMDILFNYHIRDPKKLSENRKYIISIRGIDGLEKWMKLVGMKNSVKMSRYQVWKKFGFCPTNTTLRQREEILKGRLDINSL